MTMATTDEVIKKQVSRLCSLPAQEMELFGVAPDDIREELGLAIEKYARDDEHVKAMVDWLLFERPKPNRIFRPVVGEIKEAAEEVAAGEERKRQDRLPNGCDICHGRPYIVLVKREMDKKLGVEVEVSSGAVRCSCARGQSLKSKDDARKAEEAASKR